MGCWGQGRERHGFQAERFSKQRLAWVFKLWALEGFGASSQLLIHALEVMLLS